MASTIDFYFDFTSPYAYLAHQKLPELAERYGYAVRYRPIDLQEAKLAAGNTGPSNRDIPVKLKHLRIDMQRWAARYGVPIAPPRAHGSARLNCGTFFAIDRGEARRYVGTAWHRVWGLGGAMNDDALLRDVAARMGWDGDAFLARTIAADAQARYRDATNEARERGVFGVPMMIVGEEMWWGNDRLQFLEEYLQAHPAK